MSVTLKNLESALAGESMAHIKYLYFAKLAEEQGFWEVADHFYWTADQEIKHAWGHLELLIGKPSVVESLEMAIAGETYEYTQMYPEFKQIAQVEKNLKIAAEFKEQETESKDHAQRFAEVLQKAEKRFAALAKVEQKHAEAYKQILKEVDHE
jgi:rubrerythrin